MVTVGDIAAITQGRVVGDATRLIAGIADLASARPTDISFLTHRRFLARFQATQAGCVWVREVPKGPLPCCPLIVCRDPYLAMAQFATRLYSATRPPAGCHAEAHIHPEAHIDPSATVGPAAVVEAGAHIGARVILGAQVFVGTDSYVDDDCLLHPGARVLAHCRVGQRSILHAGCIIGSDGFGFAPDTSTGRHHKIPQRGRVELGDDVEIGANTTVDRATFGSTQIGDGTKIDNLVQIGHNVVLGKNCIVVSQSGIAGSTTLGDNVTVGAQGGISGHLSLTHHVTLAARAGVVRDIASPGVYSGLFDVAPHRQALKMSLAQAEVPALLRRVRQLENSVNAMAPRPHKP